MSFKLELLCLLIRATATSCPMQTRLLLGFQPREDLPCDRTLTEACDRRRCRRHGDKGSEMTLVPFEQYVLAAEKLIAENPLGLKRVGFVSTEDPYVIEQAANLTRIFDGARCCIARALADTEDQTRLADAASR